LIQCKV